MPANPSLGRLLLHRHGGNRGSNDRFEGCDSMWRAWNKICRHSFLLHTPRGPASEFKIWCPRRAGYISNRIGREHGNTPSTPSTRDRRSAGDRRARHRYCDRRVADDRRSHRRAECGRGSAECCARGCEATRKTIGNHQRHHARSAAIQSCCRFHARDRLRAPAITLVRNRALKQFRSAPIEAALPCQQRRRQDHERDPCDADRNLHGKPSRDFDEDDVGEKREQNTETIDRQ